MAESHQLLCYAFSSFHETREVAEDDKHLTIISGLRVISKTKAFLAEISQKVRLEYYFLYIESFLPFKSANYVDPKV